MKEKTSHQQISEALAEKEDASSSDAHHTWEPSVRFGVSLVLTAIVLLFSVTNPRELPPVWELDERLSLRSLVGPALLPSVKDWRSLDAFAAEARWACLGVSDCQSHTESKSSASEGGLRPEKQKAQKKKKEGAAGKKQATSAEQAEQQKPEDSAPSAHETAKRAQDSSSESVKPPQKIELGVNLTFIPGTGWGNLAYEIFFGFLLEDNASFAPIFLGEVHPDAFLPESPHSSILKSVLAEQEERRAELLAHAHSIDIPILHAVDHVFFHRPRLVGSPNIAMIFFDKTDLFSPQISAAEAHFDAIVVGSQWNGDTIRALGVRSIPVFTVLQGVDTSVFFPSARGAAAEPGASTAGLPQHSSAPTSRGSSELKSQHGDGESGSRPEKLAGAGLVVFSGGKFEMRKAQDVVVNIFKRFREAVPEARPKLIFAWDNPWPVYPFSVGGPSEGFGTAQGMPARGPGGKLDFVTWLKRNGVAESDAMNLGSLTKGDMARVLREWADVALFPNRCEGGTNLVAMEALASGLPTILSANTGHLDLIARACPGELETSKAGPASASGCYALQRQARLVAPVTGQAERGPGTGSDQVEVREKYGGWGESEVEEGVELLKRVWEDLEAAQRVGRRGAQVARAMLTWDHTRASLREVVLQLREKACAAAA